MGISRREHKVTLELGVHNLANHVLVGETNHQTVFGRIVLVLGLDDETLAGKVIGLAFTSTTELDLEAFKVGLVLDEFDKRLRGLGRV
jgi:hypothetical protein